MKKYIFIDEDLEVTQGDNLKEGDLESCDAGILQIIDTTNGTTYYEGEWIPVPEN